MIYISNIKTISILICSLGFVSSVSAATFTRDINRQFDASDFQKLAVSVSSGWIEAVGSDSDTIQVDIVLKTKSSNQSKANQVFESAEVLFDQSNGELALKIKAPKKRGFLFSFNRSQLQAQVKVTLPKEYNMKLSTGSGSINVTDVTGRIVLDTGSGSINGRNLSGDIIADTGSGSIKLKDISGSLNADTGSGKIDADGNIHKFRADTGSGSVNIRTWVEITEKSVADTGSGGIHIELPIQSAFSLHADVGSGRIECGFPIQATTSSKDKLRGDVNGGGVLIVGDTGSGNITVQPVN